MWALISFILLGVLILIAFEVREQKQAKQKTGGTTRDTVGQTDADSTAAQTPTDAGISTPPAPRVVEDGECCGQHLVCERETLLQTNAVIEYYDDEELDALSDIPADQYTPAQYKQMREVFDTLQEKDVPGWVRSLQLRNIKLPADIREEALLIVRERRKM